MNLFSLSLLLSLFLSLSLILAFFCDRFSKRLESWSYYHKVSSAVLSAVQRGPPPLCPFQPRVLYIVLCGKVERVPTFLVSEAHTSQPSLRNTSHARHRMVWLILDFPYFLIIISRSVKLDLGHSRSFLLSQLTSARCRASTIIEKLLCICIYLLVCFLEG